MNAQPIAIMPVRPPRYDNTHARSFAGWYRDNEPRLIEYYEELARCGTPEGDDFLGFALCQYDLRASNGC